MKSNRFLFILFFICGCCVSLQAQSNMPLIGTVDYSAIFMLHPKFVDFVPEKGSFKTIRPKKDATKQIKNDIADEMNKLMDEREVLQARLDEATEKFEKEKDKILEDYDKVSKKEGITDGTKRNEAIKREYRIARLEERIYKNYHDIRDRIAIIDTKLYKLENDPDIEFYMTASETMQILNDIVDDINKTIRMVAQKKGISVVLNSSAERRLKAIEDYGKQPPFTAGFILSDILYAKYVNKKDLNKSDSVSNYSNDIYSKTRYWVANERKILGDYYQVLPTSSVLMGGEDITKDVILYIFRKNKINDNIANAVVESIFY